MSEFIDVQPAADQRQAFARWAVAQTPKIRTVSQDSFAVPADLFDLAPEEVLTGALVDGRPYISLDEGLTDYAHPEAEGTPGEPLPELPPEAYGPDSVPLDFAPLDDAPGDEDSDPSDRSGDENQADEGGFPCGLCDRSLKTARGREAHRRQAHNEES